MADHLTTEEFINDALSEMARETTKSGKWHPLGSRRLKAIARARRRLARLFWAKENQALPWPWRVA